MQQARNAAAAAASAALTLAKAIADSSTTDQPTGTAAFLQQQQQQQQVQAAPAVLDAAVTISGVDTSLVTVTTASSASAAVLQAPTILAGGYVSLVPVLYQAYNVGAVPVNPAIHWQVHGQGGIAVA